MNKISPETMSHSTRSRGNLLLRRSGLVASLAGIAVLAAACGSGQSASTTTTSSSAGTGVSARSIKLSSSTIPSVGSVLTGPSGRTLYYYTADSSTATNCTGQCAVVWPPLVVPAGTNAVLSSGISGTLGTVMRPDGSTQVTYKGHLLYYYQGDTAPGQDKGQGLGGTWFVATPSGSIPAATTTTTTGASSGHSY